MNHFKKWGKRQEEEIKSPKEAANGEEKFEEEVSKKEDESKGEGGDDNMVEDIDYDKMGRVMSEYVGKELRTFREELEKPEREAERIGQVVGEQVKKILPKELEPKLEEFKGSLKEDIKGLSKDEAAEAVEERLKTLCEDPNSVLCQMATQTAKAIIQADREEQRNEGGKGFEMPKISPEFEVAWKELSPEDKKKLTLIPRDAHQTMLEIITESPESHKGLNRRIFENLTEEEITELVKEKPELVAKLPGAVCTTPECKEAWNKAVKENPNIKEEEKSHWLLK